MENIIMNNQETKKSINMHCDACNALNSFEYRYIPQRCNHCNELNLPLICEEVVKVGEIGDVCYESFVGDNLYDFHMYFDFENSYEVNNYLDDIGWSRHIVYCEVDKNGNVFDLDSARCGVAWHCQGGEKYDFTEEQLCTIKQNVRKYIIDNNMGEVSFNGKTTHNNFYIGYDMQIEIKIEDDGVLVETSKPIMLMTLSEEYLIANKFHFSNKINDSVYIKRNTSLDYIVDVYGNSISIGHIAEAVGIEIMDFIKKCVKIYDEYMSSYVKANNKVYKVSSLDDFMNLEIDDDTIVGNIEYNFTGTDKAILNEIMASHACETFRECKNNVRYGIKACNNDTSLLIKILKEVRHCDLGEVFFDDSIISKDVKEVVKLHLSRKISQEYASKVVEYMDCKDYLNSEIPYINIDDYIVVF